jgi:hypothetical protein
MTGIVRWIAICALLAGPTVLAFRSGGFFDEPRLVAGIAAWVLVGAAAFWAERPLPRSGTGRLALAGAAALCLWTILSITWAPLEGPALDDAQRVLLYVGALAAATAFLTPVPAGRLVEPALCAGALVVVGYGMSERFVPGLVELHRSVSAGGRLEQPLTYWNAMGAVAAIGLVLAARLSADERRAVALRAAAAAAAVPFGAAVYLSFSRGAIAALATGLLGLVLLDSRRTQLRAAILAAGAGIAGAAVTSPFPWVRSLDDGGPARGVEGLIALAALAALCAGSAFLTARWARAGVTDTRPAPRRALVGAALALIVAAGLVAAGTEAHPQATTPTEGARSGRLVSINSNRYDYWRVAIDSFADHPLVGTGSGGFRVEWLRERRVLDGSQDAHSLYLETAAELGLVGLAALAAFLIGVGGCARRAYRADAAAVVGPIAGCVTYLAHAALDWDWEMPALTLIAVALAGSLVAAGDRAARPEDAPRAEEALTASAS